MLQPEELKIVLTTLSKRRAWIKKTLEDATLEESARKDHSASLKLLESAIRKIQKISPSKPKASQTEPKQELKKPKTIQETRVLIAEDTDDTSELLLDFLSDLGIKQVDHAKDGMEAFDCIKRAKEPYHIILCDWNMPELSGIEVHNKAVASKTLRGSHFIMVTGVTDAPRIKQAVQQGISDYVVKPIDMDILEEKIKQALGLVE
ncbi:MAG: response regulator [Agarilytica sp.]